MNCKSCKKIISGEKFNGKTEYFRLSHSNSQAINNFLIKKECVYGKEEVQKGYETVVLHETFHKSNVQEKVCYDRRGTIKGSLTNRT